MIVDIDGTIAMWDGKFDPHAVDACHPNERLFNYLNSSTEPVLFLTARSRELEQQTRTWLDRYISRRYSLAMKEPGDDRSALLIKPELLTATGERHLLAFDDRADVCRMWMSMGIAASLIVPHKPVARPLILNRRRR